MNTLNIRMRIIDKNRYFFIVGILFTLVFFVLTLYYETKVAPSMSTPYKYYTRYGMYLPLVLGFLTILKSYILLFFTHILHLRYILVKIGIYLLLYGFWFILGFQLALIEPRYTDLAILLIDAYAFPLLIASSVTILFVIFLSFFKR